jgi:hypothetical protein
MLRVRYNSVALAVFSRLSSAKALNDDKRKEFEDLVLCVQCPKTKDNAIAWLANDLKTLQLAKENTLEIRHALFTDKFGRDAVGELRGARVSIRDVTSTLFEIKARVIGDIKTLTNITSRHVEINVLNRSLPTEINKRNRGNPWSSVAVVTGESGSGKAYSVIAACDIDIPRGVTIIMVPNDFAEHSGKRLLPAELKIMSQKECDTLFLGCLDSFLAKVINEDTLYKAGKMLQESEVPITLFLDEMDEMRCETPSLIHAMGHQKDAVRALIKKHTKTTSSTIRLVAAGPVQWGLYRHFSAFKSSLDWFDAVPVMPGAIWNALLQQVENVNLKKACTAQPSPATTALIAIASNARCAALIGNVLEEKTLWQNETAVLSEPHLWHLYHTAVYKFMRLDAFVNEPLQRCKDLFARAFYLHLTRHDQDLSTDDQELVTKYGILTDTAKVAVGPPCPYHKVVSTTTTCADGGYAFRLVIPKGRARYTISPAAAQLGVSCFGFLDVATGGFGRNIALLLHHVATAFCGHAREAAADKSQTITWFGELAR